MWRLDLLTTFARPLELRSEDWRYYGLRHRGLVGVPRGSTSLEVSEVGSEGLVPWYTVELPVGGRRELAFHPDGRQIAVSAVDGLHLVSPGNDWLILGVAELGGAPRGILFDRKAELLWASYETSAGRNEVAAIDAATFQLLDRVPVGGVQGSHHTLEIHPTWEALSVEVSCGQDGTWLSFIESRDRAFRPMPGIERAGLPFGMVGFAPNGRWLALLRPERVQILSWPDLSELAAMTPPSEKVLFDWLASYVGDRFVGSLFSPEKEGYRLVVVNSELQVEGFLEWEKNDQRYLFDLAGMAEDLLVIYGDQRAGVFRLVQTAP
jgi:hypothetical protein